MRSFLHRLLLTTWHLLAGVLVVAALLSVGLRYALQHIDQQPAILARWVTELGHLPIALGGVDASWSGRRPQIILHALQVMPKPDGSAAVHCAKVQISLAPLASLIRGEPVLHSLEIDGLGLGVIRETDGHFAIAGLPPTRSPVFGWLLRQPRIGVRGATVNFTDRHTDTPPVTFTSPALLLRQVHGTTRIRGLAATSMAPADTTDFQLDLPHTDLGGLAELRLLLRATPLSELARFLGHPQPALDAATLSGRVWLRFSPQALQRAAFDAQLTLAQPAESRRVLTLRGVAQVQNDRWDLALSEFSATPNGPSTASPLNLHGTLTLGADTLRLALLCETLPTDLLAKLPGVPADWSRTLTPQGELRGVQLGLATASATPWRIYVAGKLHAVGLAARHPLPGFSGFAGGFAVNRSGGAVALNTHNFQVQQADHFPAGVQVGAPTGLVVWRSQAAGWQVQTPGLLATVQGLPLQLKGSAEWQPGARPSLDVALRLGPGPLNALETLVPLGALPERGEKWLREAFTGGQLEEISVALRGNLADFPFDHGEGVFSTEFAFSNTRLKFSHNWLPLTTAAAHGTVSGRTVQATLSAATFADSHAGDISLRIEDVLSKVPVLRAQGTLHTNFSDVQQMLAQSPLQNLLTKPLDGIVLEGPFDLALDLNLGLHRGAHHLASGHVDFRTNRLHSPRDGLALEALTGRISFIEHRWFGEQISATLDTMPVTLSAHGERDAQGGNQTQVTLQGHADVPQIGAYIERYAPSMLPWLDAQGDPLGALSGATDWRATLDIAPSANDLQAPIKRLSIESSLTGLALGLPAPLTKTAAQAQTFHLVTEFGGNGPRTTHVTLGKILQATVRRQPSADGSTDLSSLDLAFGGAEPVRNEPGIFIHGKVSSLLLEEWARVLHASGSPLPTLPLRFDLALAGLGVLGQQFDAVTLRGEKNAEGWLAHIESARVAGTVWVPLDPLHTPLVLTLSRLWLAPRVGAAPQTLMDPSSLPTVTLTCESFRYGDIDFGNTAVTTTRSDTGLNLQALAITNPAYQLTASGAWSLVKAQHHSALNLEIRSPKLAPMLSSFGYAMAGVAGAPAVLGLTAQWPGMPTQFSLDNLTGQLNLHVKKGRMLDIEPGSGRFFGLLSVQMLPRRLTLDFADFFKKGFAFDRIDGTFDLEHGNAYTNSLIMAGPSATVEVSGRAGLAAQDYDQRAVVTPALASSLPWAGAFFGPAGIGVAAAIYLGQKTFTQIPQQVDRFLSRRYAIIGPWHDPKIERL